MKSLQFTVPRTDNSCVILQEDISTNFYPFFHRHAEVQIAWILRGSGNLVFHDHSIAFQSGDIFYIGTQQPHVFRSDNDNTNSVHTMSIYFDPEKDLLNILQLSEFGAIDKFVKDASKCYRIPHSNNGSIKKKLAKIFLSTGADRVVILLKLLIELVQKSTNYQTTSFSAGHYETYNAGDDRIGKAIKFIDRNFANHNIKLDDIAKEACLTPQAFCRLFKKHTRITYVEYLNKLRIKHTCRLIVDSNYAITSAALESGFNSLTNFNRVFKSITGQTPSSYRKKHNTFLR